MKTKVAALTPAEAGLSVVVCSGPRGVVRDNDWPCIEYTMQLLNDRRQPVWTGEYRLGVGNVKPLSYDAAAKIKWSREYRLANLTADEENCSHHWARGVTFKKEPRTLQLHADTAAKLAIVQKVTPKLEDVCSSLLSDGAAFFDGQRFEDWAADMRYDTDSRKAEATFKACDEIGRALSRGLSRDQIDSLREWASNY